MKNYEKFTSYKPTVITYTAADNPTAEQLQAAKQKQRLVEIGVAFACTEDGQDWYEVQKTFASDTMKVMYEPDTGVIRSYGMDVSGFWPLGFSIAEVSADAVPDGLTLDGSWVYANGTISARIYTTADLVGQAEATRNKLLANANSTISLWQTELALGTITDDDKALLVQWITYIKALKALDLSDAPNIVWPTV
ncbi:tail fiber assembly protein [Nissabacter sp. SGAir0207]|uniref:tail fiber assembly protein n=1 Tax=Nissabacter sp. SGAir0207 TaxID=2126321 RepID=UPI0010CD0388|nr:tail fiber assembly protein [Nissabacter sp. SGAir0207]QCR38726.1 tail assembly chaperone [Nissabacter sp. SGAir0207]